MLGLGTLAKKFGGLVKKGAKNVAHGKGLMGDKTSALSKFRDWRDKKKAEKSEQGGPPTSQIAGGPVKPVTSGAPQVGGPGAFGGAKPYQPFQPLQLEEFQPFNQAPNPFLGTAPAPQVPQAPGGIQAKPLDLGSLGRPNVFNNKLQQGGGGLF